MSSRQTFFIAMLASCVIILLLFNSTESARPVVVQSPVKEESPSPYKDPKVNPTHLLDSIRNMDTAHYISEYVKLIKGHLFSPDQVHTYLRYDVLDSAGRGYARYREVYKSSDYSKDGLVWSDIDDWNLCAFPDTIGDINGDGYADFLRYYYPMSGCCQRDCLAAYLFDPDVDTLRKGVHFVNTIFFPKQKQAISREYSQAPDHYLIKWNGLSMDTLETIVHEENSEQIKRITHSGNYEKSVIIEEDPDIYECLDYLHLYYMDYKRIWPIETISPKNYQVPEN